jgi:hypothetical protein
LIRIGKLKGIPVYLQAVERANIIMRSGDFCGEVALGYPVEEDINGERNSATQDEGCCYQ